MVAKRLQSSLVFLIPATIAAGFTVMSCKTSSSSTKDVIPFNTGDAIASLGASYNSVTQRLNPSANCVKGTPTPQAAGSSDTNVELSEDGNSLLKEFSGQVDGTPRINFLNINSQGGFFRSLSSSKKSLSVVFSTRIEKGTEILSSPSIVDILQGKSSVEIFGDCGDSFVSQINKGGRLTVTAKFEFSSEEERKKWQSINQMNSPWGKLSSDIKNKASDTGANGHLSINIKQEGGTPEAAPMAAKTCSISNPEDLDDCLKAIQGALDYASSDFPTQVAAAPAILNYRTQPLSALIGVKPLPQGYKVSSDLLSKRGELKTKLDMQVELLAQYEVLKRLGFSLSNSLKSSISSNIDQIQLAANSCYDYDSVDPVAGPVWFSCTQKYNNLKLNDIDQKQLTLKTISVLATDRGSPAIANTYTKPIQVEVRINESQTWQASDDSSAAKTNYLGSGKCDDRCPSNASPWGSLLAIQNNETSTIREQVNSYSIQPGQGLSFVANSPLYGFPDHSGQIDISWICLNCDGEDIGLNNGKGIFTELSVDASSSTGTNFRNRNSATKQFRVTAAGYWSNGKGIIGYTGWSGAEGQSGTCGEGCFAPSLPVGALIHVKDDGQFVHVKGESNFILDSQQNSSFRFNDQTGGYDNNEGSLKLLIYCKNCE